jgi:hypothetical protein
MRSKVLIGVVAAVVAYVVFGPRDADTVVPARAAATPHGARAAVTPSSAAPLARSLMQLAHRVVEQTAADSLFAAHSWYVAPPPPPPPPVDPNPPPPPKPVAPPLPFAFMGSYAPAGAQPVIFLTEGDKVYDVHVGDTVDNTYSVDSFTNGVLVFTYKPLNQQQQLVTGGAQ